MSPLPPRVLRLARKLPLLLHRVPIVLERATATGRRAADGATGRFPPEAEARLAPFRGEAPLTPGAYEELFRYFLQGWEAYRLAHGAAAAYPGLPSSAGSRADRVEGFSRVVPLLGAWVASGRPARVRLDAGHEVDLCDRFRQGLVAGTDPRSPGYWGRMRHYSKRVVEAADIALALWLFREPVWLGLAAAERRRVLDWLLQVNRPIVHDHNWRLFVVLVNRVIEALGEAADPATAREQYDRFKSFYRGQGWFSDGPGGHFDYYNAWGIHYALFWLRRIDPAWDAEFLHPVQAEFLAGYKHLLGPNGFPILGRSVCYRMAAPAPLVLGHPLHPDRVSAGEARRALDVTWRYFIRRGAVRGGSVTQGYCGDDPRILDNYSGPASCLWSLRSLVAAFVLPESAAFWQSGGEALPVESRDYDLELPAIGWRVHGRRQGAAITIEVPDAERAEAPLVPHAGWRRLLGTLVGPVRPPNTAAKYRQRTYRSDRPFCGCVE